MKEQEKVRLKDIAEVIRSKNAGPYELTFDIIFSSREFYRRVRLCQGRVFLPASGKK